MLVVNILADLHAYLEVGQGYQFQWFVWAVKDAAISMLGGVCSGFRQ
jgi:hypothetical protein